MPDETSIEEKHNLMNQDGRFQAAMKNAVVLGLECPPAMKIIQSNRPLDPITRIPRPYAPMFSTTGSPASQCVDAGEKYTNDYNI